MHRLKMINFSMGLTLIVFVFFTVCNGADTEQKTGTSPISGPRYTVVKPGTHPGLLFSAAELPGLKKRAAGGGLAGEAWQRVAERARKEAEGNGRAGKLVAMALVYQIEGDREIGRQAVGLFQSIIGEIDPVVYHKEIGEDFFATDRWPISFAYAWDWLYEIMDEGEKAKLLQGIENWCKALYENTEASWWQEASINCGAIPVGALGLACTAIQGETRHPEFEKWFSSCIRRIQRNYFPLSWRSNGICIEGPCYAIVGYENPSQFGEALRRTGGPDILKNSGAISAMAYQMFQWMPQGGCGPIGDNTEYGRRVFAAEYLLGIGELADKPGLWTFERSTDRQRLDPVIAFLWYPEGLEPQSPGAAGVPLSRYFEITQNRAGYVYSRSEWDNEKAAWFAFVTRWENANHQHYDMNSFLFCAFGDELAAHRNVYPYDHQDHGADFEHNLVIVNQGGMPLYNRTTTCGEQASLNGLLTGLGLGHFADYVRGDARLSYQDHTDQNARPAVRADRYILFAKQGRNPYVFLVDDIQKSGLENDYHWQWYTPADTVKGAGTLSDPIVFEGMNSGCSISFIAPEAPARDFQKVRGGNPRRPLEIGLIRVHQRGVRVRYVAVAAAWEKGKAAPIVKSGPSVSGNQAALSLTVEGDNFTDLIVWQPEEYEDGVGSSLSCGGIVTDGLLAMVRTDRSGLVTGYALGEGRKLSYGGKTLVEAVESISVSADSLQVFASGKRRARENLPPLPAEGRVWLPGVKARLFADDRPVKPSLAQDRIAVIQ